MSQSLALIITGLIFLNIKPTPSQCKAASDEHYRIYKCGGFGNVDWDWIFNAYPHIDLYKKLIGFINEKDVAFLQKLKQKHTPAEAISWFKPSCEVEYVES